MRRARFVGRGLALSLRRVAAPAGLCCLLLAGCEGGIHRRGEQQLSLVGTWGHPIKDDVGWPDGEGRAEDAAAVLGYHYFVADRFAVGAAITPYRIYNQSDGDAWTGELQLGVRYFFLDFDVGDVPVGLFAEVWGGMFHGPRSVPESGSHTNFTQDTGAGFEARLTENVSWITGYRLRHLSNWGAFGNDNPSQNDHTVFTGIAISW